MKIVKKGNEYLIRTPNKTFTYKTLKGAQNKLSKLKAQQKVSQSQKQSVIVNVSTSKSRSSGSKSTPSAPRVNPTSAIFSALEQFANARPRSHELIPSKKTQDEITQIKKSIEDIRKANIKSIQEENKRLEQSQKNIRELREEQLKLVEAEKRRTEDEKIRDIFIRPEDVDTLSIPSGFGTQGDESLLQPSPFDSETESVDSGFGESEALEQLRKKMTERRGRPKGFDPVEEYYEKPNKINNERDENITTEDVFGRSLRREGARAPMGGAASAARVDLYDSDEEKETDRL